MATRLKPIEQQVIVITGATSGIGLSTARMAADRGASLVLAARNEQVLDEICRDIQQQGGHADYVVADVANQQDVQNIATRAIDRFGGFDTWVNNAALSIYGEVFEVDIREHRRLFDINYWGYVHGILAAFDHLKDRGGAIINVGSVLSDRAIPMQGPYCATKHAIKAITDAFRMEVQRDGYPISVSLIKPAAIDTPYKDHARNYMDVRAKNPPPVYAPRLVAEAILHCAEHHRRDVYVGGGGRVVSTGGSLFPGLSDLIMQWVMPWLQRTKDPAEKPDQHSLWEPVDDGNERGGYKHVRERSFYTRAALHPVITTLIGLGLLAGVGATLAAVKRKSSRMSPSQRRSARTTFGDAAMPTQAQGTSATYPSPSVTASDIPSGTSTQWGSGQPSR